MATRICTDIYSRIQNRLDDLIDGALLDHLMWEGLRDRLGERITARIQDPLWVRHITYPRRPLIRHD